MAQHRLLETYGLDLLRAVLETTSDAIYVLDSEDLVVELNAPAAVQRGASVEMLRGRPWYDLFDNEVGQRRRQILAMARNQKEMLHYEDRIEPGLVFDVRIQPLFDAYASVVGRVICMRDISQARKQERERLRLGTAIEQAVEAVLIMDENLVIQYVNQSFEDLTGYSQQQAKGLPLDVLYQDSEQRRWYAAISATLSQGEIWVGRTRNTGKDGRLFRVEKTVAPIRGQSGVILGYVSVWRDLGPVEQLERQLRTAQKMEAIGTLASGIAHDFNNILGPILLNAQLLLERSTLCDEERDLLQEINDAAERARHLVRQILHLGRRREAEQPVPFRLSTIIKECCKLLRPTLPETLRIEHRLHTEQDTIVADPTQIHQAIMNLCTNAVHAIGRRPGVLRFVLQTADPETIRTKPQLNDGRSYICLAIEDSGRGMSEEVLSQVFDPFFTTKNDGLGTGLGLPVVQNIVTQLGGTVTVQSALGQGSVFALYLPLAPAEALINE